MSLSLIHLILLITVYFYYHYFKSTTFDVNVADCDSFFFWYSNNRRRYLCVGKDIDLYENTVDYKKRDSNAV